MTHSRDAIETSYAFCRQMSRRAGSSFYAGFLLLPREKRRAMDALYAFMRHTDDLADDIKPRPVVAPDSRRDALAAWRAELERALSGHPEDFCHRENPPHCNGGAFRSDENFSDDILVPHPSSPASRLLPALADAVRRFQIPHEHLSAVIDGVAMDLDRRRYETFAELQPYCERVASAVGLACIHIWGFRGPEAFAPARKVGIALQLTNILRDLKEDASQNRVYLPLADLRQCGYSVDDLMASVADARFHRLMANEVALTEQFYDAGAELMDWLEPSGRRIFGLMTATYRTLLRKIASRPADVFFRRVHLGAFRKLQLAARWSLLPPRKDSLR